MSEGDPSLLTIAGPLLDGLRGVRWPARRPVARGAAGAHRSRRLGAAIEFTEYRPYRQGDDPRRLDWKLLARTDRAYIRVTDDHALMSTSIVVDASASMAFPRASVAKWRTTQLVALGLASVAHQTGDPVGLIIIAAGAAIRSPLRMRRGMVAGAAAALERVTPSGSGALAPVVAERAAATYARVVIVSDFLGDATDTLARARELLAVGADVYAVHIVAREELDPPERAALFSDPEDPSMRRPFTRAMRARYQANFTAWRQELSQAWHAAGASYVLAATDEPAGRIVRRVLAPTSMLSAEPSIPSS